MYKVSSFNQALVLSKKLDSKVCQFSKMSNFEKYNFCSSLAIDLELSPYLINQEIYERMDIGRRNFKVGVDITLKTITKGVLRVWDQV